MRRCSSATRKPHARQDSLTDDWYDCSAHMLWIGERTRQLDHAHVEFLRGVRNPVGCKIGPTATADGRARAVRDPQPRPRSGPSHAHLPHGQRTRSPTPSPRCCSGSRRSGHPVVWACDPMHGNTFTAPTGTQDPSLRRRPPEIDGVFRGPSPRPAPCRAASTWSSPATTSPSASAAATRSSTSTSPAATRPMCDPRLNGSQSIDLAFRVSELVRAAEAATSST